MWILGALPTPMACLPSSREYTCSLFMSQPFKEYHLPSLSFCVFIWESRMSLVCMQYISRVWTPPPQRAVWLARLLSCWLSKGSTWHSVHSVVLQPYLDEENAAVAKVFIQENCFSTLFWFSSETNSQNLFLWIQYRPPSLMKTDSVPVTSLSSVGPSLEGLNAEQACFNCNYWKLLINILWNKNIMLKTLNFMCN